MRPSVAVDPPAPRRLLSSAVSSPAVLVGAGFALLLAIGLANHEMWRDELQAWMLARASPTLPALLHNLRYEGHPGLWHLLLLPLVRLTAQPEAMQALHFAIAALGAGAFLAWAPLPWKLRALFVCGYLPLFEYGVISRGYVLALPLLWATCRLWPQAPRRWLALGGCLALLANANPYAWLLAASLLATLAVDTLADAARRRELATAPAAAALGGLLALAGLGLALWQMLPPADALYAESFRVWWPPRLYRALGTVVAGCLPFPEWRTVSPWNSALVFRVPAPLLALCGGLWLAVAFVLLGSRAARTLFALGSLALLAFTYVQYIGWARHHGHHFLLFVACCWLAATRPAADRWRRARLVTLTALLAVHLVTAAWLYGADLVRPFSGAKAAAARLAAPPLAGLPAIGYPEPPLPAVAAYSARPVRSLLSGQPVDFVRWRREGEVKLRRDRACALLAARARETGGLVAFVAPLDTLPASCPGLSLQRIGGAPLPLVPSERLATWLVTLP